MPGVRFSDSTASVLLDSLRGSAALVVLIGHWRSAFFIDFVHVQNHRALLRPLYILTGAGHQAVLLFFVLSGYLICGSILQSWRRDEWSWSRYSTHRLVRLWIVLLPALALGFLWDRLGIFLHHAPGLYSGGGDQGLTRDVAHSLAWNDFIGNALFLQTIAVPPFGSNMALWTLANEFWYYALFPLGFCMVRRFMRPPAQTLACAIVVCAVLILLGRNPYILPLLPIWLLGALLHAIPRKATTFGQRLAASVVFAIIFFATPLTRAIYVVGNLSLDDVLFGLAAFAYLWVLLGAVQTAGNTAANALSRLSARFSYTLYAVHTPILIFAVGLTAHDERWEFGLKTCAVAVSVLALIIVYAWLLGSVTESKTNQVRAWVERRYRTSPLAWLR